MYNATSKGTIKRAKKTIKSVNVKTNAQNWCNSIITLYKVQVRTKQFVTLENEKKTQNLRVSNGTSMLNSLPAKLKELSK